MLLRRTEPRSGGISPVSKKFTKQLAQLDRLLKAFREYEARYPQANFGKTVTMLEKERAELAATIGRTKEK